LPRHPETCSQIGSNSQISGGKTRYVHPMKLPYSSAEEDFDTVIAHVPFDGIGNALRFSHCLMPQTIITASGSLVVKASICYPFVNGRCCFRLVETKEASSAGGNSFFSVSHPHTTINCQPKALNSSACRLSRSTFLLNFSCQNSVFEEGIVMALQPGCRCQKHPRTSTTVLYFGRTMSGCPGRLLT